MSKSPWPVPGVHIARDWPALQPLQVLQECDGMPVVFTCRFSDTAEERLAYLLDEWPAIGLRRFLAPLLSEQTRRELHSGPFDLTWLRVQTHAFVIDVAPDWSVRNAWVVNPWRLPGDVLPRPGLRVDYRPLCAPPAPVPVPAVEPPPRTPSIGQPMYEILLALGWHFNPDGWTTPDDRDVEPDEAAEYALRVLLARYAARGGAARALLCSVLSNPLVIPEAA